MALMNFSRPCCAFSSLLRLGCDESTSYKSSTYTDKNRKELGSLHCIRGYFIFSYIWALGMWGLPGLITHFSEEQVQSFWTVELRRLHKLFSRARELSKVTDFQNSSSSEPSSWYVGPWSLLLSSSSSDRKYFIRWVAAGSQVYSPPALLKMICVTLLMKLALACISWQHVLLSLFRVATSWQAEQSIKGYLESV